MRVLRVCVYVCRIAPRITHLQVFQYLLHDARRHARLQPYRGEERQDLVLEHIHAVRVGLSRRPALKQSLPQRQRRSQRRQRWRRASVTPRHTPRRHRRRRRVAPLCVPQQANDYVLQRAEAAVQLPHELHRARPVAWEEVASLIRQLQGEVAHWLADVG